MNIIYTLIILCVLILVHEFGHFAVAKLNGIIVEEFSLGMGPKIIGWGKGETKYSLRILPIGGYVKMTGEDEESDNERAFCNKSVSARMAVTFAGPAMNIIFAIIFFMIAFMYFGTPATYGLLGSVQEGLPAAEAGLRSGDVIVSFDDTQVDNWNDIVAYIDGVEVGQDLTVGYMRDGEFYTASLTVGADDEGNAVLGITQGASRANLLGSIKLGFVVTVNFTVLIVQSLVQMITGSIEVEVAGPVGIVSLVGQYANVGFMYLFLFAGILSINLGVMNLLPIPALDGSRLVFLLIEGIRRKPIDRDKEAMVHFVGFMLLLALMVVVTYLDIEKLIR
jgi:regulator of sigma E protease